MKSTPQISQSQLKYFRKLLQKKYLELERKFLVEGFHLVEEALQSDWEVEVVLISEGLVGRKGEGETGRRGGSGEQKAERAKSIEEMARRKSVDVLVAREDELQKLSEAVTAQGVVAVVRINEERIESLWKELPQKSIIVALENISDPGNLGTMLRTCDWFGVNTVLLSENSADLFNSKVLRSTMGAVFHLPIYTGMELESCIQSAKRAGCMVIGTDVARGTPLDSFKFPHRSLLIFGNEAHGASEKILSLADARVTIPGYGKAESLNVAISCGIILNTLRSKL